MAPPAKMAKITHNLAAWPRYHSFTVVSVRRSAGSVVMLAYRNTVAPAQGTSLGTATFNSTLRSAPMRPTPFNTRRGRRKLQASRLPDGPMLRRALSDSVT